MKITSDSSCFVNCVLISNYVNVHQILSLIKPMCDRTCGSVSIRTGRTVGITRYLRVSVNVMRD